MKMLKLILFLAILKNSLQTDDLPDECTELFEFNIHPSKCCKYPSRKILDKDSEKCKKSCKDIKEDTFGCCAIDCTYEATGVLTNGKFNEKAVMELYENYLNENGGGKYDQWLPIIEESIEKCSKAVSKTSKITVCNIPEYLLDFLDCVDSQNFLKCPKFTDSKACNRTRNIAEQEKKCGKKFNEIFVINHTFWKERDDEKKETKSEKKE